MYRFAFAPQSSLPGPSPSPRACEKILVHGQECEEGRETEASWNTKVHSPILEAALEPGFEALSISSYGLSTVTSNDSKSVTDTTPLSTSARIDPEYLPSYGDVKLASKMVDFIITSDLPDVDVKRRLLIQARRCGTNIQQIFTNHTPLQAVRWKPIAISIETKVGGENRVQAVTQVGIWVSAHFKKLQRLMEEVQVLQREDGRTLQESSPEFLPFLPLLIVQGHAWDFLVAVKSPDLETVSVMLPSFYGHYMALITVLNRLETVGNIPQA